MLMTEGACNSVIYNTTATAISDSQKRFFSDQKLKGYETPAILYSTHYNYNYKGHVDEAMAPEPIYVNEKTEFVRQFIGTI